MKAPVRCQVRVQFLARRWRLLTVSRVLDEAWECPGVSLSRALTPFTGASPSGPNHLQIPSPLRIRVSTGEFGRNRNTQSLPDVSKMVRTSVGIRTRRKCWILLRWSVLKMHVFSSKKSSYRRFLERTTPTPGTGDPLPWQPPISKGDCILAKGN